MNLYDQFEKEVKINQCDCDFRSTLKPSALMRYVQQISTDHCNAFGITAKEYEETHTAFLLAKVTAQLYGTLHEGETMRMLTKASRAQRAIYHRYTYIFNQEGKQIAFVNAHWILVDTRSRRILRKPPEGLNLPCGMEPLTLPKEEIPKIKDASLIEHYKVRYSQVDLNNHLNNASYFDIICDLLPEEHIREKYIKKIHLEFHHEILWGDSMDLYLKQIQNLKENGFYIGGISRDTKIFEAWIEFEL